MEQSNQTAGFLKGKRLRLGELPPICIGVRLDPRFDASLPPTDLSQLSRVIGAIGTTP